MIPQSQKISLQSKWFCWPQMQIDLLIYLILSILVKVTAQFPHRWWNLLPKEASVPTGSPMGICTNLMNNLETGSWKQHQAEAKNRGGITTKSAFNPATSLNTLPECITQENVPVVKKKKKKMVLFSQIMGPSDMSMGGILRITYKLEGRGVNQWLRLVPLFLTLNRIMQINSNLPQTWQSPHSALVW